MTDTIFAISSGAPPAAIGIVRLSGPRAGFALERLAGRLPAAREAALQTLRGSDGATLDRALTLWFPGPRSATGEDCAELHCHGGRAVIAAVCNALRAIDGMREAEAGEFTRRAFENGRIDLAQAESLGDLLAAETELQRCIAQAGVGGALSERILQWRDEVLALSAVIEALLDFADEDDNHRLPAAFGQRKAALCKQIAQQLDLPRGERLRDGVRVVLAGPPNSGKSSLFNELLGEGAAIVTPVAGTTRDVIERSIAFAGVPFVLVDTAGLRDDFGEAIEAEGIARAKAQLDLADIVLWLGPEGEGPSGAVEVQSRSDDPLAPAKRKPDLVISSVTGSGVAELRSVLIQRGRELLPKPGSVAINARQAAILSEVLTHVTGNPEDILMLGENLRAARSAFDRLLGNAGVEDMLDDLFGRFCIGK